MNKAQVGLLGVLLAVALGLYWYQTGVQGGAVVAVQGDGTGVGQNLILGLSTDPVLGKYLSAYNGMTVYTYANDGGNVSNCTGACADTWPPYTVPSTDAINVPAVITGTVGAITRADGTIQVTYNSAPLYFYAQDAAYTDTKGEGVGEVWHVAKP
jgi:predicted lipoprotein with Yx(FWY)xxD motif